ncbi:MAG: hypothetical protein HDR86_06335 [Bacteroides sp.]|nr:hypothetical protein [Bacteroides sp.]
MNSPLFLYPIIIAELGNQEAKKQLIMLFKFLLRTFGSLLLLCTFSCTSSTPSTDAIKKAKEVVESAQYQVPVNMGNGLILDRVSFDTKTYTLVYDYHYTLPVNSPSEEAIKERKQAIIHLIKSQPSSAEMDLLKSGISMRYNYYTENGGYLLYSVTLTQKDLK